jgi:1,4-dihydroxy-2-naphthoyl-CoA hydrolase
MAAGKAKVAVKKSLVKKAPAKGSAAKKAVAKKAVAKKPAAPAKAPPFRQNGIVGANLIMNGQPARRIGVQLVSATRTKIVARLPIRPHHTNRGQRVNGGVLMAFADLLGAAGTVMNLEPGWRTTTLESKTNFFAAGQPPVLLAESTPLHVGRSTNVWQTRITNEDGRLVALVTQTQIVLPPPVVR